MQAKLEEAENNAQTDSPAVLAKTIDAVKKFEMQTIAGPNGTVVVQVRLAGFFSLEEFFPEKMAIREPASSKTK